MAHSKTNLGLSLLVLVLALGLVNSQGGFFSNVRNAIFCGSRPAAPPPGQRQPPPSLSSSLANRASNNSSSSTIRGSKQILR